MTNPVFCSFGAFHRMRSAIGDLYNIGGQEQETWKERERRGEARVGLQGGWSG